MKTPIIILGSDHGGYLVKEHMKGFLESLGYTIEDKGAFSFQKDDDYPKYIIPAAESVAKSRGKKLGIVFGGTGLGECIVANKVQGIRAAVVYDIYTAKKSKEHNNANIICIGGRTTTKNFDLAERLIRVWLKTDFSSDPRHIRRIRQIERYG